MRRIALALVFFEFISFSHAQEVAVDSRGEPVFQLYSADDARLQFNRRTPVSASYLFYKKDNKKNSGTLLQLSVLNSGDLPLTGRLRNIRPGFGIKLGNQHIVSRFDEIGKTKGMNAWGYNLLFNADNIRLYDTLQKSAGKKYPLTYGAEANYTHFLKNKNGSSKWRKALSLYLALMSTWNDRNLLSYQEISKVAVTPDVVALQDFDGRFGVLKKNFFKYRMAVSFPMFYKRFNATPYWAAIFGTQNSPSYHIGAFTNLLASSLDKSNKKLPATFGLGFDWVYATEHLSSKVNLFVKASVSFGKLKEE